MKERTTREWAERLIGKGNLERSAYYPVMGLEMEALAAKLRKLAEIEEAVAEFKELGTLGLVGPAVLRILGYRRPEQPEPITPDRVDIVDGGPATDSRGKALPDCEWFPVGSGFDPRKPYQTRVRGGRFQNRYLFPDALTQPDRVDVLSARIARVEVKLEAISDALKK